MYGGELIFSEHVSNIRNSATASTVALPVSIRVYAGVAPVEVGWAESWNRVEQHVAYDEFLY